MTQRDIIHRYLGNLSRYLARLDPADADEVVREIESHIFDVIEQREAAGQPADASEILQGFGDPRELAAQYVAHLTHGAPPPRGFRALQRVKKGATVGLYYTMAVFGYSVAGVLLLLAVAKSFAPESVGVWAASHGQSYVVGFLSEPGPGAADLLGLRLIPVAVLAALVVFELTRRVLRVLRVAR
jgi:hypothetical protein